MTTSTKSSFGALCTDLGCAVRTTPGGPQTLAAVKAALQPYLGRSDLLTADQRRGDPAAYRAHVLHVPDDGAFSLLALVWLPGQVTPIHDHLCWCVVGVHEGAEYETRYALTEDGVALVATGKAQARPGDVAGLFPPGDIHQVRNEGDTLAISLHVYGADVRDTASALRRSYDLPVRTR